MARVRIHGLFLLAVWGSAIVARPQPALADNATEAKLKFDRGLQLYERGRVREALDEFFVSNRLSPNPSVAFNIATCLDALNRFDDAYSAYSEYLAHDLSAAERKQGEEALARILPKVARLKIDSTPAGASIFLDRKNLGQYGYTPRSLAAPPGDHQVLLSLSGYETAKMGVTLVRGKEATLDVTLSPQKGRIRVSSRPPGARIHLGAIDGDVLGTTPATVDVPFGMTRIYLELEGYSPSRQELTAVAGESIDLDVALELLPPSPGRLRVLTNVPSALVAVDHREAGFTPLVLELTAREHAIEVHQPGYRPWAGTIRIEPNGLVAMEVTLEPLEQSTGRGPWPWTLLSASAASGLVALGLGIGAVGVAGDFEKTPTRDLYEEAQKLNTAADVMLGVSLISAAATAALFLFGEDREERSSSAELK
jgi:outer membrane receptor for ferrienterochelin and colicins